MVTEGEGSLREMCVPNMTVCVGYDSADQSCGKWQKMQERGDYSSTSESHELMYGHRLFARPGPRTLSAYYVCEF